MSERGDRRRERQRLEAEQLLKPLIDYAMYINRVVQCGLGDWPEGPVLLKSFPHADFMAVEPVRRYCWDAWKAGFRGPIIQGALWHTSGNVITLQDFKSRTSMLDPEPQRFGSFETVTVTLDDAVKYVRMPAGLMLLWMDCEGVELEVLKGAQKTLKDSVMAIVCELKDEPKMPNWPKSEQVVSEICGLGFQFVHQVADNGLFVKDYLKCPK
jgi:FkbM family methyltransferase